MLSAAAASAYGNYEFYHINGDAGLPHQQVNSLAEDADGRIWIATRNGLARFDGYSMETFYHSPDDSTTINHNFIYFAVADRKGRVWFSSNGTVMRYDRLKNNFVRYNIGRQPRLIIKEDTRGDLYCADTRLYRYDDVSDRFTLIPRPDNSVIYDMAFDRDNNVYMSSNKTIYRFDSAFKHFTEMKALHSEEFLSRRDCIVPLYVDSRGLLWVGRNGKGVMSYNPDDGSTVVYDADRLSDGTVRVIKEDAEGKIWLCTEKGITIISPDGEIEILRENISDETSLSSSALRDILFDRNGNVWVGTYFSGLDVSFRNRSAFMHFKPGKTPEFHAKVPREVRSDGNGHLWIATEDAGLYLYDMAAKRFRRFADARMGSNIHSLCYDSDNNEMWVGTFRNGLFCIDIPTMRSRQYKQDDVSGLHSGSVFSIIKRRDGLLYFGTPVGLYVYDRGTDSFRLAEWSAVSPLFAICLHEDAGANFWVGTTTGGLFCITSDGQIIRRWNTDSDPEMIDNYITAIFRDDNGRVWVGTSNNGLFYLDDSDGRLHPFGTEYQMQERCICAIAGDRKSNVWVTTNLGMYRIAADYSNVAWVNSDNGLPYNQFNFASIFMAPDSLMYAGTVNGLLAFDPDALTSNITPMDVHLGKLVINRNEMHPDEEGSPLAEVLDFTDRITLTHQQAKSILISYGVYSPGNVRNVKYQVWLGGVDTGWRDVGPERKFLALNLSPGEHELKLRASVDGQSWDDAPVRTLAIKVLPPVWRTWWAICLYVIAGLLIVAVVWRIMLTRIKDRQQLRLANLEKEQVMEINREKMDFFTRVSHELKTPLSLIMAPLRQLSLKVSDNESAHHLNVALKNATSMVKIIDELVTFNKVESGNFQFYLEWGNPIEFLKKVTSQFEESAADRQITLYADFEDNGESVWFSPLYVERIVNNLLSNALKFTLADGKIYVKGSITAEMYLKIEVRDTGIGMIKSEVDKVFDLYYQTKRGHNVNSRGWGLGLFLVKRLTEIHRGHINVESEPGVGSTFTVLLDVDGNHFESKDKINDDRRVLPLSEYSFSPLTLSQSALSYDDNAGSVPSQSDARPSVLLVEDNPELLKFLKGMFASQYVEHTAVNGEEALAVARDNHVDLIISDVMMPVLDGVEMCRRLKSDLSLSHIPVILLTAKSDSADIVKGYESGAEAYVAKPFDPQILNLQVQNILKARRRDQERIVNADEDAKLIEESTITDMDKDFIKRINHIIEQNIDNTDFCIADIISALGVSRTILYTKMRSLMNISIGDYIRKKRLQKARALLLTDLNISEVAYRTGFSEPNYFSKVFRKEFGISPSEFIAQSSKHKN